MPTSNGSLISDRPRRRSVRFIKRIKSEVGSVYRRRCHGLDPTWPTIVIGQLVEGGGFIPAFLRFGCTNARPMRELKGAANATRGSQMWSHAASEQSITERDNHLPFPIQHNLQVPMFWLRHRYSRQSLCSGTKLTSHPLYSRYWQPSDFLYPTKPSHPTIQSDKPFPQFIPYLLIHVLRYYQHIL